MKILSAQSQLFTPDLAAIRRQIEQAIHKHKGLYIFQGIVFIILGIAAAAMPMLTAMSLELVIGILLITSGIIQLVVSHRSNMHAWSILSSFLSIAVGGIMLWHPFNGLIALLTVVIAFLIIEGVLELLLAFKFRPARNWGWMLFSGIIALSIAAVLLVDFPGLGIIYLGYIVAINLILYGISLLMLVSTTEHSNNMFPAG